MKTKIAIIIFTHFTLISYCQSYSLSKETNFKNGIYLSHKDFATNNPTFSLDAIRFTEINSNYSFQKIFKDFTASPSIQVDLDTVKIWGVCINETPYINSRNYSDPRDYVNKYNSYVFIKPMFIGNICLFTNERPKNNGFQEGPYYNNSAIDQYLLKASTGEIEKLKPEYFLNFIKDDTNLYEEYSSLSNGKKKKELIQYLIKYNNKNPITIHSR